MVRFAIALLASSLCFAAAAAEVDLRATGALEALQHSNPAHYRKVDEILERTRQFPQAGPARWLPAAMNATDVRYTGSLMKPSYPPKQTLRFRLDDVGYVVDVTRHDVAGRLMRSPH